MIESHSYRNENHWNHTSWLKPTHATSFNCFRAKGLSLIPVWEGIGSTKEPISRYKLARFHWKSCDVKVFLSASLNLENFPRMDQVIVFGVAWTQGHFPEHQSIFNLFHLKVFWNKTSALRVNAQIPVCCQHSRRLFVAIRFGHRTQISH
jgi:hypothetical protein